ncbi:tellurite resistance/C4-dicarboxylate transporter family protein [Nocardia sp. XZ_19_385]|uniref:tellurite resistance/C4-dicarboxylate transporter family protein n=1 Tax=Nocardia sp. XZ_19_385 TaxID=2769488 RepID=UPI00188F6A32|nr:tellurite resistance/C4-dicarboxylate transporter family protein [Nocardia sp. XZ_19_385]
MTQQWWRELPPAAGAFVMATGILSVGLHLMDFEVASWVTLALAGGAWVVLAVDFGTRLLGDHSRWETEAATAPALTGVAATTVLGTRLSLAGWQWGAVVLLVVAVVAWPVLLGFVVRHWGRRMPGAAFLVCVATQGVAVLGATLAQAGRGGWLMWVALGFFGVGIPLYVVAFAHFDVAQVWRGAGDQWVAAGALAISALAASKLAAWQHWTGVGHTVLRVVTLVLLGLCLMGYVVLLAAEVFNKRPGYNIRRWATVFPLGMTAVATLSTAAALKIHPLHDLGAVLLAGAAVVWVIVFAELLWTSWAKTQGSRA